MRERIAVENKAFLNKTDFVCIEYIVKDLKVEYKKEQVPETFEELKKLCKDLKDVDIEEADDLDVARIIIHNADLIYFEDEFLMIAGFKKLEIKPEKMWQTIKSLIGEE